METHVNKWGNSFGIRIPKALAQELNLTNGLSVNIQVQNHDTLVIKVNKKYDLLAMIEQMSEDNKHPLLLDSEDSQGEEAW